MSGRRSAKDALAEMGKLKGKGASARLAALAADDGDDDADDGDGVFARVDQDEYDRIVTHRRESFVVDDGERRG